MTESMMQYLITQGPFALLFMWLLYDTRKESNLRLSESNKRERELHTMIDKQNKTIEDQNEILKNFSDKYDIVITKLDDIEDRLPPR